MSVTPDENMNDLDDSPDIPTKEKVLGQSIPWEGYQRAELLKGDQVELIKKYDKKDIDDKVELVNENGEAIAELFMSLVIKISNPGTLQYLLTLIDELFEAFPPAIELFLQLELHDPKFPCEPFLQLLNHTEPDYRYIKKMACKVLAAFMLKSDNIKEDYIQTIVRWFCDQLRKQDLTDIRIGLSSLQDFVSKESYREPFAQEDGLHLLVGLMKMDPPNPQIIYEAVLCAWLLSYSEKIAENVAESKIIKSLVDLIASNKKEKILRVCLATLRNLLNFSDNNEAMIDGGILRQLSLLNQKKWGDEDIIEDLEELTKVLSKSLLTLSSWDRYVKEIMTGDLEWSPSHKSEQFWRDNVSKFEETNFKLLGVLQELIRADTTPIVKSVACFDLGEFARFHPNGKAIIQRLNLKIDIMKLLSNEDSGVRKQALFAIQKMIPNFKFIA